jgi:6-phosphogluconolactonase (cycloisomerase 2 family)
MNFKMGIKGEVTAVLTDIRNGSKKVFTQDNLILNHFLDRWFTQNVVLLSENTMNTCVLGTDDTPPTPSDTALGGTTLASSNAGTTVYADAAPNEKLPNLPALPDTGQDCAFSPDGKYLAVAHISSPNITVYDVEDDFANLPALSTLSGTGQGCSFSPDGKYLAVTHNSSPYITVYDVEDGFTKLSTLSTLSGIGYSCSFSPDGKYLAVTHRNSPYITVYDVEDGFANLPALSTLSGTGYSCSFSPDGKYLAVAHRNSPYITVYDVEDGFTKLSTLSALSDIGWGCAFSPDGKYLAVTHNSSPYITVYDVEDDFAKLPALSTLPNIGQDCAFSPNGKYLAVAHAGSPYITVYDVEDGFTKLSTLSALSDTGYGCAFSPDGKYLAVAHNSSPYITVYDLVDPAITERSMIRQWTFPAGVGTGVIKKLGLGATSGAYGSAWVSFLLLDQEINKSEFHQLDIFWKLTAKITGISAGIIEGGQWETGENINWALQWLPKMFHAITMSNRQTAWFGISGTPALALGTSNSLDLPVWWGNGIQGRQFARYAAANIREVMPYVPGSLERTVRLFLETDQGTEEPIAEMAMENFARITFNPALDKTGEDNPRRLYVDVTFGWQRGESNA